MRISRTALSCLLRLKDYGTSQQGGVISPLLSNIYLTEVDRMLERAKEASRDGKYTYVEYARFADDLVILIDAYKRHDWLMAAVENDCARNSPSCGLPPAAFLPWQRAPRASAIERD
jgi:Reverse transcriptase (RNA-dependent DNA polymerase)